MGRVKKIIFLLITIAYGINSYAQGFYFQPTFKQRINGGVIFSFFGKDPHVAKNIHPLFGFTVGYNTEIELIDNSSILAGLTYTNQAVQFNGYFVAPGHTYLFDETFAYTHRLRFQSLQVPVALKLNLNTEADNAYTPYFLLGLGFNYIFNASVSVVSDSTDNRIYKGPAELSFENHIINKQFNSFIQGGFGLQKNMRRKERALFIELIYKFDISRMAYSGYENSNNIHFRNSNLSIMTGIKF